MKIMIQRLKIAILIVTLAIAMSNINAQPFPNESIIPPEPSAYEFMKQSFMQADYYRGLPSISIPIYTINLNGFSLPIYMSYNYNGFNVNEMASNVGLGWSLNYGGIITKNVNGTPDNAGYGYDMMSDQLNMPDAMDAIAYSTWRANLTQAQLKNIAEGRWDLIPDVYCLSVGNINVRFIKLADNTFSTIPYQPIKIENPCEDKWLVTDESGNTFIFGKLDPDDQTVFGGRGVQYNHVEYSNVLDYEMNYASTWYLRSITTSNADIITFDYETENITLPSQVLFISYENVGGDDPIIHTLEQHTKKKCSDYCVPIKNVTYISSNNVHRIISITTKNEIVNFIAGAIREDLLQINDNAKSIDEIIINDNSGNRIKKYVLTHDYLGNSSKRLILDKFTEYGITDAIYLPSYEFTYNTSKSVPKYGSFSQDIYGFYNGKYNTNLVPSFVLNSSYNSYFTNEDNDDYVNRYSYFDYAVLGALTNVKFPSGGNTSFYYERNSYAYVKNRKNSVTYSDLIEREVESVADYVNEPIKKYTFFSLKIPQRVVIEYKVIPQQFDDDDFAQVSIIKNPRCMGDCPEKTTIYSKITGEGTSYVDLEAGVPYALYSEVYKTGEYAFIRIKCWDSESGIASSNYITGGVRLSKIVEADALGNNKTDIFNYTMVDDDTCSSGIVLNEPLFDQIVHASTIVTRMVAPGFGIGITMYLDELSTPCNIISRCGNSINSLQSIDGHIGYKYVTVLHGEQGEFGRTVYQYTSSYEYPDITFPVACPSISLAHYRGKLLSQTEYNSNNQKVYEKQYHYKINDNRVLEGIGGVYSVQYLQNDPQDLRDILSEPHFGTISTRWIYIDNTTETVWDINGQNPVTKTTSYFYDNPTHAQVSRTSVDESNTNKLWTYTLYPDDYVLQTGNIVNSGTQMSNAHILNRPVETLTFATNSADQNVTILSGKLYTYRLKNTTFNIPGKLQEVYTLENTTPVNKSSFHISNKTAVGSFLPSEGTKSPFLMSNIDVLYNKTKPDVVFDLYDNYGNLLQYHTPDGVYTSYVWGYNNSLVVAKIVGAQYSSIPAVYLTGLQTKTGQDLEDDQIDLRELFSSALVTTYIYKPLVGVLSITDEKGLKTNYHYDDLNRLEYTDINGNILKRYQYHFQGQ